eukprot:TRINITY_DN6038_c2_g1_i1.p1 TRINITY_DN6038_c2_g1~~TRINITY_DN6038_c2_g1_i1.p1  ORF type:complete len:103 (-),score=4.44 TRINITY_DN6038_c2_g1_i1:1491-1799(-)
MEVVFTYKSDAACCTLFMRDRLFITPWEVIVQSKYLFSVSKALKHDCVNAKWARLGLRSGLEFLRRGSFKYLLQAYSTYEPWVSSCLGICQLRHVSGSLPHP